MKESLINELRASEKYLNTATACLAEEDSGITPAEGMMSAAQQIAHIAQTIDWFIEGAFGDGFDMNFEESAKEIMAVTSLTAAREWCTKSYADVIAAIESKSEDENSLNSSLSPI